MELSTRVAGGISKALTQKVLILKFQFSKFLIIKKISGFNTGSIGIAYIGTFNKKVPSEKMLMAGFLLMNEGVQMKKMIPDYKIYAHRQLIPSESPGAAFYELIKKWDHWSEDKPEVLWWNLETFLYCLR